MNEETNNVTLDTTKLAENVVVAPPEETRRGKHGEWLLTGLYNGTPIWQFDWDKFEKSQKYSGAKLRALRTERGCGSKKVRAKLQTIDAYEEAFAS